MKAIVLALACASSLMAQSSDTSNSARARAVVMRHMDAIGGVDAYSAIQSVRILVSMTLPFGIQQRVETWTTRPNLMYGRIRNQVVSGEFGFDGKTAWSVDTEEGAKILAVPPDIMGSAPYSPYEALIRFEPRYAGVRERGGKRMEVLEWTAGDGQRYTQYYDLETGLFSRLEIGDPSAPASVMRFERYRKFDQLLYATLMTTKLTDANESVARVMSVDHKPIDPKRFELPKEIKVLTARNR
jgi:hypothetical protein